MLWRAVLSTVGYLTASMVFTHLMPVEHPPSQLWQSKIYPDVSPGGQNHSQLKTIGLDPLFHKRLQNGYFSNSIISFVFINCDSSIENKVLFIIIIKLLWIMVTGQEKEMLDSFSSSIFRVMSHCLSNLWSDQLSSFFKETIKNWWFLCTWYTSIYWVS